MLLNDYGKTRAELIRDAAFRLDDPLNQRWNQARIIEAIDEATLEFCLSTRLIIRQFPVRLREEVSIYDLVLELSRYAGKDRDFGFPIRFEFVPDHVDHSDRQSPTRNQPLSPLRFPLADWRGFSLSITGNPEAFARQLVSPNKVLLYPAPKEDGDDPATDYEHNLLVWMVAVPNGCTTTGPDPDILAIHHQAIPPGAAARLLYEGNADEVAAALEMDAEFEEWKGKAISIMARGMTEYANLRPM